MQCMICQRKKEVRNIPLYVIGSGGLNICHICEMALVTHIRELMRLASFSRILGYRTAKKETTKEK